MSGATAIGTMLEPKWHGTQQGLGPLSSKWKGFPSRSQCRLRVGLGQVEVSWCLIHAMGVQHAEAKNQYDMFDEPEISSLRI